MSMILFQFPVACLRVTIDALEGTGADYETRLVVMMPQQWRDAPWSNELLQVIEVEDLLTAPGMRIVKRTRLPLTPAAPPLLAVTRVKDRKLGRRQ